MTTAVAANGVPRRKLKHLASVNDDVLDENIDMEFEMQYIDIGNVDSMGRISEVASFRFGDAPSRARRLVRDGDVIISTVRTYLQAIAQIREPPDNLVVSTGFAVIRPFQDRFDARYCRFALREPSFLAEVEKRSVGANYPAINAYDLADIPIPIHSLPQQRAIADYLEREIAQLDTLATTKERMLELLAERRQALIVAAVAGRIDSVARLKGAADAIFEDARRNKTGTNREYDHRSSAGYDGLTTQPVSPYPTKRLKHVVSLRQSRVNGNGGRGPYIGLENIEPWTGRLSNGLSTTTEDSAQCNVFRPGDVLFGKLRPYLAKVWVAEFAGKSTTECLVMKPVEVESRFLGYVCLSQDFIDAVDASTFGSKMPRAEWSSIGNMPIPVPKRHEQRAVADYLDRKTTRLDMLKVKIQGAIALLTERRAALIAAAVTGQIAVEDDT